MSTGVGPASIAALLALIVLTLQGCTPLPEEAKEQKFLDLSTVTTTSIAYSKWTVTTVTKTGTTGTATTFSLDPNATTTIVSRTKTSVECTEFGDDCALSRCCVNESMQCYVKDETWSSCKLSCKPGEIDPNDPPGYYTPWSCFVLSNPPDGWINGTYTTGYWDCCKPSCAWPGKGNVDKPARSCAAGTHEYLDDELASNVCFGGTASGCADNQPFAVNQNLSMGFVAAAVGGGHGLAGDENCGQCFELRFTDERHDYGGGSHPSLVGKTMIVQVNNIGYDVSGEHAFDIEIPGAGQGKFYGGCGTQFPGFPIGDFDCDQRYGGCDDFADCKKLPEELQAGCEWRFIWYMWKIDNGTTDNPYISFRRVRCPTELTDISGSAPLDDADYLFIDPSDYR